MEPSNAMSLAAPAPRSFRSLLNPKSLAAEAGVLLAGTGGAQLVVMATTPILTRMFSPAEFAGLFFLVSINQFISRISSFKYETAISVGRNRPSRGALATIATWPVLAFSALALVISFAAYGPLTKKVGADQALCFALMLPLTVLLDNINQIITTWSVRERKFKVVSTNDIARAVGSVGPQLAAGVVRLGGSGLMIGQAIGSICALGVLLFRGGAGELLRHARRASLKRQWTVARRYYDFPFFQMPKAMLNAAGRALPGILILAYFTKEATGLFGQAFRLTLFPATLVNVSLGRVLLQRFAELQAKGKSIHPLLLKSTLMLTLVSMPLVLVVTLFGPTAFAFILGERWRAAGEYAIWTCMWSAAMILATPAQMALMLLRKNRSTLLLELAFTVPRVAPFPIFAASHRADLAVLWCSLGHLAFNLVLIPMALSAARQGYSRKIS
jgi:O-antigen/teichoic acid export membrane protein